MNRLQALATIPQAQFCRKHRHADDPPMTNVSSLRFEPFESSEGREPMMELCRALDRLLWKSFATPTREERGNE